MSFTFKERQELNTLSKEVLGTASRWYNTYFKKGTKSTIGIRHKGTLTTKVTWLQTFDDVKNYLLVIKKNQEEMKAKMKAEADRKFQEAAQKEADRLANDNLENSNPS